MAAYSIITLGCQMNKADSERISSVLEQAGMVRVAEEADADVVVVNSCSVRQAAEDRVYGIHHNLSKLKKIKPKLVTVVTGCMAGRDHDGKIRKRLSTIDLFIPIQEIVYLPKRISEINPELTREQSLTEKTEYTEYLNITPRYDNSYQAFIPISNGCNKFCTYCVVPYSRGKQKDRAVADILKEVKACGEKGVKEITILGQTVNLYMPLGEQEFSKENPYIDGSMNKFGALMWEINQIKGIERIHFTAAHPMHMDANSIQALTLPKHLNYLHLPVQSGSNEVLKRMNRPYTREKYIDIIQKVRTAVPDIALGSDIIVGFCGETRKQFEETLDLYRICDFDISYNAMYSVRSGTTAVKMYKDDVSKIEKKRRWNKLHALMQETVLRKNQQYIGKTASVLVDHCTNGLCSGNSREMKRVSFRGNDELIGKIVSVNIDRALEWMLYGSLID